jgi:stage V sporulation protein G
VEITEVRIKLMEEPSERLKAFCSITFDDSFVVRDLKIIEGSNGPFVAMPSRKLTSHCTQCNCKNHLRAGFCNQCGARLKDNYAIKDEDGRAKLYADIAHPINSRCREMIQDCVIDSYEEERSRAQKPGYISSYDDFDAYEPAADSGHGRSGVTPTHVQQAEKPHGPHHRTSRPSREDAQTSSDGKSFGAGVFD